MGWLSRFKARDKARLRALKDAQPRGGVFARPGDTFTLIGDKSVTVEIDKPMSVWKALGKARQALDKPEISGT